MKYDLWFGCKDKNMIYLDLSFLFFSASSYIYTNMVRIKLQTLADLIITSHSWRKSDFKLQPQIYKSLRYRYICVTKTVQNVEPEWIFYLCKPSLCQYIVNIGLWNSHWQWKIKNHYYVANEINMKIIF